jgi:hypothetical protein
MWTHVDQGLRELVDAGGALLILAEGGHKTFCPSSRGKTGGPSAESSGLRPTIIGEFGTRLVSNTAQRRQRAKTGQGTNAHRSNPLRKLPLAPLRRDQFDGRLKMDRRSRAAFLALIVALAAHWIEEYVFRFFEVLAPARFVRWPFERRPGAGLRDREHRFGDLRRLVLCGTCAPWHPSGCSALAEESRSTRRTSHTNLSQTSTYLHAAEMGLQEPMRDSTPRVADLWQARRLRSLLPLATNRRSSSLKTCYTSGSRRCAPVAQLDRALASGAKGRGFESPRAHQFPRSVRHRCDTRSRRSARR